MKSPHDPMNYNGFGKDISLPHIISGCESKESILINATMLFAKKGYAAVSMDDVADSIGIAQAELYNRFPSKDLLWKEVVDHVKTLYLRYFDELSRVMERARTFAEVLAAIFDEPRRLTNEFTCHAFSMLQKEQFRDEYAAQVFDGTFLDFSINVFKDKFERCVADGWVSPFDTGMVATLAIQSVLVGIDVKVQEFLGRPIPFDPSAVFGHLQACILRLAHSDRPGGSEPDTSASRDQSDSISPS